MFTPVTVTGTILDEEQVPQANVWVQFSLTDTITDTSTGYFVASTPVGTYTNAEGQFSITLTATDDTTTFPKGQVYQCQIQLAVAGELFSGQSYFPTYFFPLSATWAPTVDLAQLISITAIPSYVGPTGATGPSGGPTGAQGPTGPAGGPTGPTGPVSTALGPTGPTGMYGPTGPPGSWQ